jgi:hypothetical protein
MSDDDKADKTLNYGDGAKGKRERAARVGDSGVPSAHDVTRQGVGHDPVRPPQRIDAGTRRLGRHVAVALAIRDPFERATVARALVQGQCTVVIVEAAKQVNPEEVAEVEILVADFDAPEVYAIVDALRGVHPDLPIVACTSRREEVERGLRALKYGRFEVHPRGGRIPDLIEAVKRLARA